MNPVIFFDELDKVSDTPRGEEITGVLTHLTDHSQNKSFIDRYFEGIPLDMSRALFIFSFNDESRLNNVLKDRLTLIHTEGFGQTAKLKIAREYLLPELLTNVGMKKGDIDIGRDELNYLCQRCGVSTEEGGVRGIKQSLESVILHVNELRMTQETSEDEHKADNDRKVEPAEHEAEADGGHWADAEPKEQVAKEPESRCDAPHDDAKYKADGKPACTSPRKADAGSAETRNCRAEDGEMSKLRSTTSTEPARGNILESDGDAEPSSKKRKKKKRPPITLPLKLTKELIEELVEQKTKKDGPAMMYI